MHIHPDSSKRDLAFFSISIGLSAFSLFLVEPILGKTLLPWFGGSAAVWSAALLFFQVLLTGGYAYAAWLSRKQARLAFHIGLLLISLILLLGLGRQGHSPIIPTGVSSLVSTWPPVLAIFFLLTITIGLPFFLLSANSTLVQAWFQRLFTARSAYRLYALSNAASIVALLCYPLLIEPNFDLSAQGWGWVGLYAVFLGVSLVWMVRALRHTSQAKVQPSLQRYRPSLREVSLWLGLSACASILLLSITNYLTQQVAVIPFLWVLPLVLYLLSFVLTFSGERWYPRQAFIYVLIPVMLLYDFAMANGARLGIPLQVAVFGSVLFLGCMICNGELYRLRPAEAHLSAFYLTLSAGGALGGLLVNFVAPVLFKGYWELPLGILFFCGLFLLVGRGARGEGLKGEVTRRISFTLLAVGVLIAFVRLTAFIGGDVSSSVETQRNFYGVLRVRLAKTSSPVESSYQLINGSTIHGAQFLGAGERTIPTVYYGPDSGVGLTLRNYPRPTSGLRVGALGLGVGTIAAYGRLGDVYRFYELNPEVIELAEGRGGYFTFLADSPAKVEIVGGDARLSLEREAADAQEKPYDILVVDVFTGDAIPVHLLDEQAFGLYLDRLKPNGVLAVHITNGYLDLVPVVWGLADHFQLQRALIVDPGDERYTSASTWVLLARQADFLSTPAIASRARDMRGYSTSVRLWTDEYSNLFTLLKH